MQKFNQLSRREVLRTVSYSTSIAALSAFPVSAKESIQRLNSTEYENLSKKAQTAFDIAKSSGQYSAVGEDFPPELAKFSVIHKSGDEYRLHLTFSAEEITSIEPQEVSPPDENVKVVDLPKELEELISTSANKERVKLTQFGVDDLPDVETFQLSKSSQTIYDLNAMTGNKKTISVRVEELSNK